MIPVTEPVQNYTEESLWEILDIKQANFSVDDFSVLTSAYERTPLKFKSWTIIQLGSNPKRIRYYDDEANFTEEDYYPSNDVSGLTEDVAYLLGKSVDDEIKSVGFQNDGTKKCYINPLESATYYIIDNVRVYNEAECIITIDGSNPTGAFKIENQMNYYWDRPELKVLLYKNNAELESNYLGGFRVPYGWGSKVEYDLNNKDQLNLAKGFWKASTYLFDWNEAGKNAATSVVSSNNDEILTPNKGVVFQLTDSDFDAGYGKNNKITYFAPSSTEGQSTVILNHLDQGKLFFIHKAHDTTKGFMMIHESLVAEIYNKDVTDINELVMLFGPKSRGRLGKANQTAPEGYIWNWNGEAVPDTVGANELNPGEWLGNNGDTTTTWSSSVKSACYSVGTLANDGSAALIRGDVMYDNTTNVASMVADSSSKIFVLPVKTGGGTFGDTKIFPLYMGRNQGTQNEWDSYTFEESADAIGTLLRISYDAAVAQEEAKEQTQAEQLQAGLAGGRLFVKEIKVG